MSKINKNVLITGGAGFVGYHLAHYLRGKVNKIRVIDRIDCNLDSGIEFFKGDIRDYKFLLKAMQDIQIVIHACGVPIFFSPKEIHSVNVDGTDTVLKAAELNNVERVIYLSSDAVYGNSEGVPIKEDVPLLGSFPLAESKKEAETLCMRYRQNGRIITVFRPNPFMGAGKMGIFAILFEWIKEGRRIPLIVSANKKYQLLDIEDFCDAVWLAMTKDEEQVNDTFSLATEEFGTVYDDISELVRFSGTASKIITIPAGVTKLLLNIFKVLSFCPVFSGLSALVEKEMSVSLEKAKNQLNWRPERSNAQSLIQAYKWFCDNKYAGGKNKAQTNRAGLQQGILKIIKHFF